jgi:hypothetical protein
MRKWMALTLVAVLVFGIAAPAFAAPHQHAKPVRVSHPYTYRQNYKVGQTVKTWGWVTPKAADLTSKTVDVLVYVRTGARTWEQTKTIDATLGNPRRPKNKTRYATSFALDAAGRYRMRALYTWEDATGVVRTRLSSYKYFRVVKPKIHTH